MIEGVLSGLFKTILSFVIACLSLILNPIYEFIRTLLPFAFEDFIDSFSSLINSFIGYVPFLADLSFLPSFTIHMIVNYLIFKYTVKFTVFSIAGGKFKIIF